MKTPALFCLVLGLLTAALGALDHTFVSEVDGVRYESKTTDEAIQKTGGLGAVEVAKNHQFASEPKGSLTLLEAAKKADKVAAGILGDAYTGKNPRWLLQSAERLKNGAEGTAAFYYRMSYSTREGAYSDAKFGGPHGNLQVIVLLDGTVLPVEKIGPEKAESK